MAEGIPRDACRMDTGPCRPANTESAAVNQFLGFVIFSAVWAIADHYIAPPIARLIALLRGGGPHPTVTDKSQADAMGHAQTSGLPPDPQALARFGAVNLGLAEGLVGLGLGFLTGLLLGQPVLAVSVTTSAWSWIATVVLIIASLVGATVHQILDLLLNRLALR